MVPHHPSPPGSGEPSSLVKRLFPAEVTGELSLPRLDRR